MVVQNAFEQNVPKQGNTFLLIHKTLTPKKPPFFLKEAVSGKKFMRKYPQYKIIISGDYHVPFIMQKERNVLINTGTLIRNKKDMENHVPYIWHIEHASSTPKVTRIEVPHLPYKEVFDVERISYDKEHGIAVNTEKLKSLIKHGVQTDDIQKVVWVLYKQLQSDGTTLNKKLVEEVLNECKVR